MITPELVKSWIEAGLKDAFAEVEGDGRHFAAVVVCPEFDGVSMVEQHRMVYAGLGDKMDETIHALSLRTLTPQQWSSQQN